MIDAPVDRLHPLKQNRPIASGKLPLPVAIFTTICLIAIGLGLAANISFFFFFLSLSYVLLHLAYSTKLKQLVIIDVMVIASGFILRVYSGAVAINAHTNAWLLLCVISFSLFLAIGKRQSEKTLLQAQLEKQSRPVLSHYPEKLLSVYTTMFATTTWLTYALFTFQQPTTIKHGKILDVMSILPRTFINQKLLMITIPLVIYGVMRYLQLIYDKDKGDSPAEVLLSDKPLLLTIALWGFAIVFIIYGVGV